MNLGLRLATGDFVAVVGNDSRIVEGDEDDDYLERLRRAGVPRRQVTSVRVESRRIGLTRSKVPEQAAEWYERNLRRFQDKWGWAPPPTDPEAGGGQSGPDPSARAEK